MPVFQVTDPDTGRSVRLTGDSAPTDAELEEIFAGLPAAPEQAPVTQSGRGIAGRQASQRKQEFMASLSPEQRSLVEDIGPGEAALIGAGRGLTTLGRGLGLAEPEDPATALGVESLRGKQPGAFGVGEIAGETAPFLLPGAAVAGIPGQATRVAATTALGVGEGGLITRGEGGSVGQQLAGGGIGGIVAGTLELALPRLSRFGRQAIRRSLGREPASQIIDDAGNPSQEFVDALQVEGRSFDDVIEEVNLELADEVVDPRQIERQQFLETQGIEPTRAQISRTANDFQAQQEAAKTSTAVREALEGQEAILTSRFDQAVLETGGQAQTPTSTVTDALVTKATVLDDQIGDLYRQARERAPGEQNVRFTELGRALRRLAPSDRRAGGNISATVGDLRARGVMDDNFNIVGRIDVETAEEVRKGLNQLFDGANEFGNITLRRLKDSLDNDVFRSTGDDLFQEARQSKSDFESELSRANVSRFDQRRANLVRDVLENKIDPDTLINDVVFAKKWRAADIQQLRDYIATEPNGQAAFDDLRAETLNEIRERAFIGPVDQQGSQALSRDKLEKAINKIGRPKLEVLFDESEVQFLDDMLEVATLREPVRGTATGLGPTAQAVQRLESRLAQGGLFGQLINPDISGRRALRAPIRRITREPIAVDPSPARTATALGGSALAAPLAAEDK